jgi:hypothetical protein
VGVVNVNTIIMCGIVQAYSISLMESWEPYLDFYKPNIATSVNFVKLTLGTVAPEIKGLHPHINVDL